MKRIVLITGGQRSGKSQYAEQMALHFSDRPVYLATANIWDDEFKVRVDIHKKRRGDRWINIEEPKYLSHIDVGGRVVVIDCVTLWCTNFFYEADFTIPCSVKENTSKVDCVVKKIKAEFDHFVEQDAFFIFVTNEIGSGGVSEHEIQRRFTDVEGWVNQYIAAKADEVIVMISGIPVKIK